MIFSWTKFKSSLIRPNSSLFENYAFKKVFCFFSALFFTTTVISFYIAFNMNFSLTAEGLNNLVFNIFRVPFSIVLVFISLTTLFSIHLTSFISNQQLESVRIKNNFDNYYKHRDEFKRHILSVCGKDEVLESVLFSVHRELFPESKNGDFRIDSQICDENISIFESSAREIINCINRLSMDEMTHEESVKIKNKIKLIEFATEQRCLNLGFNFQNFKDGIVIKENFNPDNGDVSRYNILTRALFKLAGRFKTIFSFDESYKYIESD